MSIIKSSSSVPCYLAIERKSNSWPGQGNVLSACRGEARRNLVPPTGGVKNESHCQLGVGCLCSPEWRLERRRDVSINLFKP